MNTDSSNQESDRDSQVKTIFDALSKLQSIFEGAKIDAIVQAPVISKRYIQTNIEFKTRHQFNVLGRALSLRVPIAYPEDIPWSKIIQSGEPSNILDIPLGVLENQNILWQHHEANRNLLICGADDEYLDGLAEYFTGKSIETTIIDCNQKNELFSRVLPEMVSESESERVFILTKFEDLSRELSGIAEHFLNLAIKRSISSKTKIIVCIKYNYDSRSEFLLSKFPCVLGFKDHFSSQLKTYMSSFSTDVLRDFEAIYIDKDKETSEAIRVQTPNAL